MHHQDFTLVIYGFILLLVHGSSASHQRRGLGAGVSQVSDFDCPEEFGYYPHPTDCTQYYVCVFGGALLESCTGGLMYSHELQTCDWPRNVGCGESGNSDSGTVSTIRVTDPRTRAPQHSRAPSQQQNTAAPQTSRNSHRQEYVRHRQPEVIQQQLYTEEDLGPAEEIETDRQQRVYRGQPSTIGQVQRDRDGLRSIKTGVHSQNVIPSGPDSQEKISVVPYGSQRPSAPRPQEQYSDKSTIDNADQSTDGDRNTTNNDRWKRQIPFRTGSFDYSARLARYQPANTAKIPIILIPGPTVLTGTEPKSVRYVNQQNVRLNPENQAYQIPLHAYYGPHEPSLLYRPALQVLPPTRDSAIRFSNKTDEAWKLSKATIQTDFRPMTRPPSTERTQVKYIETAINPVRQTGQKIIIANVFYQYPNATTERLVAVTGRRKSTESPFAVATTATSFNKHRAIVAAPVQYVTENVPTTRKIYHSRFNADATTTERPVHYKFVETPKNYRPKPTEKPKITHYNPDYGDKKKYNYDYYDEDKETKGQSKSNVTSNSYEYPKEYEYDSGEILKTQKPDYDYREVTWQSRPKSNLTQNLFSPNNQNLYMTTSYPKLNIPGDRINMETIQAISQGLKRPIRYRSTTVRPTTQHNQIETPRTKVPDEYYENFKPFPTKSLTTVDSRRQNEYTVTRRPVQTTEKTRVDQVQSFQVTTSLPPLTPTQRTIERYNTSQRYQPNQYDQYYTVYDEDADLYRGNDYVQQEYQTPSSTPSSNLVHQYRGQTTFKQQQQQQQQQQQAIELEQSRETIPQQHQQPIRNSFSQDVYSPTPVVQDYNDQYNSQIDDQHYQHLVASTPKAPNRSVSTNSSKDTFPEPSLTVSRISDNTTSKTETVNRRSDSSSYFEPSDILIPPPRVTSGFSRPTPKFSYTTEGYRTITPTSQRSAEPPRNGGALAKTLNNFDSLLTSFFSAVSGKPASGGKTAPETIVRSEIGRIHHDPIIITDDYRVPTSTSPPEPTNNDYLAYFVEIEPKKPKAPERIITKDNVRDGQEDAVSFNLRGRNRPYNTFVRLVPNGEEHQNIQLTASLDIEPILKPTTTTQQTPTRGAFRPVIETVQPVEYRPEPELTTEKARIRGNTLFRPRPEVEPKLIENANPYKFVVVDAERTTEKELSSPAPFIRNPENEDRNRFDVKNRFRLLPDREPKHYEVPTESNIIRTEEEETSEESKELEEVSEEVSTEPETSSLHSLVIEPTTSTRKPFRIRVSSESESEDGKKSRRVVKVHRSELRNQRLNQQKYKRIRKPSTQSPVPPTEELTFNRENDIHSTYRPIVVLDSLSINKELTGVSNESVYEPNEISEKTRSRLGLLPVNNVTISPVSDTVPRGFEKATKPIFPPVEIKPIVVPNREPSSSEKPLFLITKPQTNRNVTVHENRATTTKPYVRGKFKPSENSKIRFRPTTATPDSETTPGPHLSTRQPSYTIGTGNEVTVNRGTPPSTNRGTRPTLKPSTAIVSKASEFIDIYRYPPRRPANLYATPTPDKSAAKCRKDVCLLPDCSCGGKDIPGGYSAEEIPQLVLLTFDDSVNDLNKGLYSELFERGRVNPNGCPISATFYVSHEWTDYSQVQNLYANGHEIASHSITHSFGEQFSQKKWTKEIAGQREILAAYGGVRLEDIRGMRAPFLAVGGNKMFKMLYDSNFTYDSSMPIYENRPPSWPYTLDYKLFHDCMIPPCPTKSYPGVWEVPMVMWQDLNGGRCSMGDACSNPPTADGVYKMLIKNFERHFTTNRAPFGLYYHAAWFTHEHHKEGFIAFLDTIVNMPEVWLVTTWQAIEYVRDPQPLSTVQNFPPFQCNVEKAKKCNNPKVCNLWHKSGVRYMRTCQPCPDVYPWTGKTGVKNSRVDNEIIEE